MRDSSDEADRIYREAKEAYVRIKRFDYPSGLGPTKGWQQIIDNVLSRAMAEHPTLVGAVQYIQEHSQISNPHKNNSALTRELIREHNRWLDSRKTPLSSFDSQIQESRITHPDLLVDQDGRKVSTMFFWHLGLCLRIFENIKEPIRSVLEIGGGYGEAARLTKLLSPQTRYFIVDLPETLFFSYLYTRANFPEARCKLLTEKEHDADYDDYDFVFVPVPLIENIYGKSFDLVVNTASLGEMTQRTVNGYMKFIHERIQARYFYSVNRYGRYPFSISRMWRAVMDQVVKISTGQAQYPSALIADFLLKRIKKGLNILLDFPPREFASGDGCECALILDPYWEIIIWNPLGRGTNIQIEPANPAYLEVLARRLPKSQMSGSARTALSGELLAQAAGMPKGDERRQRLMWDSVRLAPSAGNLKLYCDLLAGKRYLEYVYYKRLADQAGRGISDDPERFIWD